MSAESVIILKIIRIKRYPPLNFPEDSRSPWGIMAVPPASERDKEFLMLFKANPNHPLIIEKYTETVEIEVNDKAFRELTWLFKRYRIPFKPTEEGVEIKHVKAKC